MNQGLHLLRLFWKKRDGEAISIFHKLQEHGMTCIFAATEKDNDNKLTVIIDFATPESMMGFKNDEELTQRRIEAGAIVETTVMTPMTSEAVTNFSG